MADETPHADGRGGQPRRLPIGEMRRRWMGILMHSAGIALVCAAALSVPLAAIAHEPSLALPTSFVIGLVFLAGRLVAASLMGYDVVGGSRPFGSYGRLVLGYALSGPLLPDPILVPALLAASTIGLAGRGLGVAALSVGVPGAALLCCDRAVRFVMHVAWAEREAVERDAAAARGDAPDC